VSFKGFLDDFIPMNL